MKMQFPIERLNLVSGVAVQHIKQRNWPYVNIMVCAQILVHLYRALWSSYYIQIVNELTSEQFGIRETYYSLTVLLVAVSCELQLDLWPVGSGDQSWATLSPAVSESLVWFCSESPALSGPVRSAEEFCPSRHCNEPPLRFSQTPPYRLSLKLQPGSTITHTHTTQSVPHSSSSCFLTFEKGD